MTDPAGFLYDVDRCPGTKLSGVEFLESENYLGQSGDCWLLVDVLVLVVVSEWLGRGGEREERGGEEHKIIASLVRLQY